MFFSKKGTVQEMETSFAEIRPMLKPDTQVVITLIVPKAKPVPGITENL